MKILGIDPGTAITGWAVIDTDGRIVSRKKVPKVVGCGVITTKAKTPDSDRLEIIYDSICDIINKEKPDIVAVEELFFFKNVKTVMSVSQTRGAVLLAIKKSKTSCAEFTPLEVKQAVVGYGRADKNQVQEMVKAILCLKNIPKPDDAADALAIALCCMHHNRKNPKF